MPCLDENQIQEFVEGLLSPQAAAEVEEHIAHCPECRSVLSAVGHVFTPDNTPDNLSPYRPGLIGQVLQGTYRMEELIGKGGMGHVYKASHLRLHRPFAIKVLSPQIADHAQAWARFQREAEIASKLAHPHIVEVIDFNRMPDGMPYIVMELLEGEDLQQRLKKSSPMLPFSLVGAILRQAASALQAAHAKGIVHRDLKPSNIFLCQQESPLDLVKNDIVKIMDFGISKVLGANSQLTLSSAVLGSPAYMAPEQVDSHLAEVDHRTDIFAMGAILYRMLAGRSPFTGSTVPQILFDVVHREVEPIRTWRPDLPIPLEQVILQALEKRPEKRQGSMGELWREFAHSANLDMDSLDSLPTKDKMVWNGAGGKASRETYANTLPSRIPTLWNQLFSKLKRHGLVALSLVLIGAGLLLLWFTRQSSHQSGPSPTLNKTMQPLASGEMGGVSRDAKILGSTITTGPTPKGSTPLPPVLKQTSTPDAAPTPEVVSGKLLLIHKKTARNNLVHPVAKYGTLSVQTTSATDQGFLWANVFLDGKPVGRTALTLKSVPIGVHLLEVNRQGYKRQYKRIRISEGKRLPIHFELYPQKL